MMTDRDASGARCFQARSVPAAIPVASEQVMDAKFLVSMVGMASLPVREIGGAS